MLAKLQNKFDEFTQREQIIIAATLALALWAGWDTVFYSPMVKKQKLLQKKLISLNSELNTLQQTAVQLETGNKNDPNLNSRTQLETLQTEHQRLLEQLIQSSKKIVPPQLMAQALGDILNKNNKLKLIKLDTLEAQPLLKAKRQQKPIYKHGLTMSFSGGYLDTIDYLKALEALPWHFIWGSIDYQVKAYPEAEITLRVYTLSFKESWLGV